MEFILAAANRYNGVIYCGPNHGSIGQKPYQLFNWPDRLDKRKTVLKNTNFLGEQGFITNTLRWVDRQEAARIAINAKQITETRFLPDNELDSSDMKGAEGYKGTEMWVREQ